MIIIITLSIAPAAIALTSKVILSGGHDSQFSTQTSSNLTEIINSLGSQNWKTMQEHCSEQGFKSLQELVMNTNLRNVNPLYETKLINLPSGEFEVRDIKVMVDMKATSGNPFQYLVFTLNQNGLVDDVRFALENRHYQEIIKQGEKLKDFAFRQQILHFIEIFRTAYNRKDIEYLKKMYSDDALIIVGRVVEVKPDMPDMLASSSLSQDRIQFIRLSKTEYIHRLENKVFKQNDFIKVNFSEVELRRHPSRQYIYGVTLKQDWHTSTYSDEGYLFLMIDFSDQDKPLIHVRSWQPEKFPDGSLINLGDFEVID